MRKEAVVLRTLAMIVVMSVCTLAYSREEPSGNDKLDIQFTPYLWIADLDGDAMLKGRTGPVDASFGDIWNSLDFALMGRVEAWKDRWGLIFDGLYLDLGADFKTPQASVSTDIDFKQTMLDLGIGYRFIETPLGQGHGQKLSFDLLAGGRYASLEAEVDIVTNGPLSGIVSGRNYRQNEEWIEPFVGGRIRLDLNDKLDLGVRADIGGFGLCSGSQLTWNLVAGIGYQLTRNLNLKAGYRILDIDYERGSGSKKFGLDAQLKGPVLGLTLTF
ncbi:MAG: outer membrane beta-barrel protein [Planctomycetota bacterium]|jgi:hypothetical protein